VVTVENNQLGRSELAEMKQVLESRGYTDIEIKPTRGNRKLVMMVGNFSQDRRPAADALAERLKRERFKNRYPFREAYVVRTRRGN